MTTKLSTTGQIVLPKGVRRRMDLRPGDQFETRIEGGRIVLVPKKKRAKIALLSAGKNAPILTSEQIAEILSDFP